MNKAVWIGVGCQGGKAVSRAENTSSLDVRKIYVSNQSEERFKNGEYVVIPCMYEPSAWCPDYPVKSWFADKENEAYMDGMFEDAQIFVVAAGLGGITNTIAKRMLIYLKEKYTEKLIYFVGSLPFREETDFLCNHLCNDMLDFLKNSDVAYTLFCNDNVRSKYDCFDKAYMESYHDLSSIIEGFTFLSIDKKTEYMNAVMGGGLVYYHECTYFGDKRIENKKYLTYKQNHKKAMVKLLYHNKLYLNQISLIYSEMELEYGDIDWELEEVEEMQENIVHVKIICQGISTANDGIKGRKLNIGFTW